MTMQELYESMKRSLTFLGLPFAGMELVDVKMADNGLTFSYAGMSITIPVGEQ